MFFDVQSCTKNVEVKFFCKNNNDQVDFFEKLHIAICLITRHKNSNYRFIYEIQILRCLTEYF